MNEKNFNKLDKLRSLTDRKELAVLLGFKPKALSYLLFHEKNKYFEFDIPKKGGGTRKISAPCSSLKNLQKRLADLLYECRVEIEAKFWNSGKKRKARCCWKKQRK